MSIEPLHRNTILIPDFEIQDQSSAFQQIVPPLDLELVHAKLQPPGIKERTSDLVFADQWSVQDQLLLTSTRAVCAKHEFQFAHLQAIQKKFVTHYRCGQCGLLPLYYLDLLHVKRVRCKKCGQAVAFKSKGKYGKLRKEIAFEMNEIHGGDIIA